MKLKSPKEHPERNWKWVYTVIIQNGAVFNFNFFLRAEFDQQAWYICKVAQGI